MKVDKNLNHSASHVLAAAVLKLYPGTKIGFGPAIDEGFYYDFEFENNITEADLKKIEKVMKKIISGGYKVVETTEYDPGDNEFKKELIDELNAKGEKISYYALENPSNQKSIFTDLCKGGHIESVAKIKHFKLLSLAGAYWRGDSNNKQLTRIYGTAWETKEQLDDYLKLVEERKERDHRKIGREMELFMFHPMSGQGFPIWLESGLAIKNEIQKYIRGVEYRYGFREVETPALGEKKLYETSGHWEHYSDDMFRPIEVDNENLVLRPMTCPHHVLIYSSKRHSYRDLPIRMSEQSRLYRYEKSGALTGLERVRSMMLTEGHIFAREDQIKSEFANAYKLIIEAVNKMNIKIDYISLSLRDPNDKEKYFDDDRMWESAENKLREVMEELNIEYEEKVGEAAFYGPKVDIQVKTALGHEITLSTLQLDLLLPQRFDISYIDSDEKKQRPVLIHRGLLGTYERLVSILLEQTKGDLPFWIAPRQFTIIPVNEDIHLAYAKSINDKLIALEYRTHIDLRNERLGKKIREAQISKTKFQIVLGDEEIKNNTLNVRAYGQDDQVSMTFDELIKKIEG